MIQLEGEITETSVPHLIKQKSKEMSPYGSSRQKMKLK